MRSFLVHPRPWLWVVAAAGMAATAWFVWAPSPPAPPDRGQSPGSTLDRIVLTEFNEQGEKIWELTARTAEYQEESRVTVVTQVAGKFFRNGKPIIEATGEGGTVNQNNREIVIRGSVRAVSLEEKAIVTAEQMVWQADLDVLTATGKLKLEQPDRGLRISGKVLRARPSQSEFAIEDNAEATVAKPPLKFIGPALIWNAAKNTVTAPFPFGVRETAQDLRVRADQGMWDIGSGRIAFRGQVRARAPRFALEVNTAESFWDIAQQRIVLPTALTATDQGRGISLRATQGEVNFAGDRLVLTGEVAARALSPQADIQADRIEWAIPSQEVVATGGVRYRQAERDLDVAGERAVANLLANTVQVTGADVMTQITLE
ncbi:MAG: LPS export ABC transporter periplasmic protein LptC [Oscillatoriales cyanobacterium SM2_1_8]|nr:LPS export ABC transporter periplasmic protein LptC [Oscillatoriales cyanobacterium SM2_1_8]